MGRLAMLVCACATAAGCAVETPATLVVVDTDVPPMFGRRLRIDLYKTDSTWYSSRDFAIRDESDLPASFGIASDGVTNESVLVRLRLYPENQLRRGGALFRFFPLEKHFPFGIHFPS